ncbi:MAG: ABC transporter permease [Bacteroidaceae bacterium]|nr:ABC transporter permease [Bacteroidaceae bacterium]
MIKQHLRQAWTMMKQHKFFTTVYITGTAISIALAMTLFIVFYIKLGNIYPEKKRDRTLVIENGYYEKVDKNGNRSSGNCNPSRTMIEQIKNDAKHLESIGYCIDRNLEHPKIINVDGKDFGKCKNPAFTNSGWWHLFDYKFLSGRGYTEKEEHDDVAVLSRSYAMQLFADTAITGRSINITGSPYRIIGVVEDVPHFMRITTSDMWIPINSSQADKYKEDYMSGPNTLLMTAPSSAEKESLKKEVEDILRRMAQNLSEGEKCEFEVWEHWRLALMSREEDNFFAAMSRYFYMLLAFLFIPALNLCGIISSRMKGRMMEVGVRKAYGATNGQIISQVLWENLLLTAIGAVIGLLLSYIVVYTCNSWIVTFFDIFIPPMPTTNGITQSMLLNPTVILGTLSLTLLLNIASALLPTVIALKKDIVQSLYQRR